MALTTALSERSSHRLDIGMLRRGSLYLAAVCIAAAPFVPDPVCFGGGALVPYILLTIIDKPTMPKALAYILLWQWAQTFTREILAVLDSESMSAGVYGENLLRSYWYARSLITLALAFRLTLRNLRPPTMQEFHGHERWRAPDLIQVYFMAAIVTVFLGFVGRAIPSLEQPISAAAQVKVVALFLLATYVFTTGQGGGTLAFAVIFEIAVGVSPGFFSDFRGVFIYIAFAALASRLKWSGTASIAALAWFATLLFLALFWTSVKVQYREWASGGGESQAIVVPLDERMAYLGNKLVSVGETDWGDTTYHLLLRFAYVDIFAQVIGVADSNPEPIPMRQWQEALAHVFQPRFLFPGKAALSDSDVFARLMRADPSEQIRQGTSISVGYMAEIYADMGFPGMLAGMFVLGTLLALVAKYFMSRPLPWMLREGIIMGLAYTMAGTGMEISLPKFLGTLFTYFLAWALIAKFALPIAMRWLDGRAIRSRAPATS